ncbi:branched-chain amino acid ABC transporter substrate-binding protein [Hahella sp. CCB-MM4]|uniref:ABC transporter substrate-binding protein n=1 Tax=Hahella sp. (strain CCB-MM4) TaxID=1926491 RepID=UPI000B9A2797|nr:ABC transporter substrate-binding protein [Hahella sp. CCB-MM4]OZG70987.1 branched-chain amino acid ABC transporter substrate-binding protein [Hahella sp. CCB-MM4]
MRWFHSSLAVFCLIFCGEVIAATPVKIGLNYPQTGRYQEQGLAQRRAAFMAVDEINASGGILGHPVELIIKNTGSKPDRSERNVSEMIDREDVVAVFGGSSSAVAIAGGKAAKARDRIYFGTLTYSNATTGTEGHSHMFRESYNAWMGAKVLSKYLKANYAGKKYFFITADYTWGWSTEKSIRIFSDTMDKGQHPGVMTPFPTALQKDFAGALEQADKSGAEILVLVLFGDDMVRALEMATNMGIKEKMAVVVPNLTLGMAKAAGPAIMEGVVGAAPWTWEVPYIYNFAKGKEFVEKFSELYGLRPSSSAASAYSILMQYRDAVERAKSFKTSDVIKALENHHYTLLKDEQFWRPFDHQNIQTVYAVRCKNRAAVLADPYNDDYFEIIDSMTGSEAAHTQEEWLADRRAAGKPDKLL